VQDVGKRKEWETGGDFVRGEEKGMKFVGVEGVVFKG